MTLPFRGSNTSPVFFAEPGDHIFPSALKAMAKGTADSFRRVRTLPLAASNTRTNMSEREVSKYFHPG